MYQISHDEALKVETSNNEHLSRGRTRAAPGNPRRFCINAHRFSQLFTDAQDLAQAAKHCTPNNFHLHRPSTFSIAYFFFVPAIMPLPQRVSGSPDSLSLLKLTSKIPPGSFPALRDVAASSVTIVEAITV